MRYEFSWTTAEGDKSFSTSCPKIAESMMRSSVDFPQRTPEIDAEFEALYGSEPGKFEKLLVEESAKPMITEIKTGIKGLIVRAINDNGIHMC